MNDLRNTHWNHASTAILLIKPELAGTVRMLGKIDSELHEKEELYRQLRKNVQAITPNQWDQLHDSMAVAHLWVLGAYELIRTLDEIFIKLGDTGKKRRERSLELKRRLERVRIPLAKLERPARGEKTDFGVAYPALDSTHGIAWKISDTKVISRAELSSAILGFLEFLHAGESPA